MYNFSSLGINCFQILGALNEKALPTNEFGGMGVFKEIVADDRRALVGLYISIRSWIYNGDKLFNDLKTRQAILNFLLFLYWQPMQ